MIFRIGQDVQCIDDAWELLPGWVIFGELPVKGRVYTISGFCDSGWLHLPCCEGAVTPYGPAEVSFKPDYFRPVVKTDISVFTRMLEKAPKRETIDA